MLLITLLYHLIQVRLYTVRIQFPLQYLLYSLAVSRFLIPYPLSPYGTYRTGFTVLYWLGSDT